MSTAQVLLQKRRFLKKKIQKVTSFALSCVLTKSIHLLDRFDVKDRGGQCCKMQRKQYRKQYLQLLLVFENNLCLKFSKSSNMTSAASLCKDSCQKQAIQNQQQEAIPYFHTFLGFISKPLTSCRGKQLCFEWFNIFQKAHLQVYSSTGDQIHHGRDLSFVSPPLSPRFWNAIEQDIHGKQSSCQKAK